MDSPTTRSLKLLEARVIELKRQYEEDADALKAMIHMKTTYMTFKMDSLRALISQMRKRG